jgi:hypothetical protein
MVVEQAMRGKVKRATMRVAVSTIVISASAAWAFAIVTGSAAPATSSVDQVALAQCMSQQKGNCEAQVPGLAECMADQRLDCNQSANAQRQANFGPAQPGTPSMTQAQAIAAALALAKASSSVPVVAREMTISTYEQMAGEQANPAINPDRLVWVVTVHVPIWTPGTPQRPGQLKQAYTVVFDATSSQGIEMCIGCDALSS